MTAHARKQSAATEEDGPPRKNLWVDLDLHKRLKGRAVERGVPLQELVEEYLLWALLEERKAERGKR